MMDISLPYADGSATVRLRALDFAGDRASLGIHVGRTSAEEENGLEHDERLVVWDLAVAVEVYPAPCSSKDIRGAWASTCLLA